MSNHTTRARGAALLCLALTVAACQSSSSSSRARRGRPVGATAVQGLLGASEYHKLEFERADPMDPSNRAKADLSTMPTLGVAGHHKIAGDAIELGMDGGLLVSWEGDTAYAFSSGSGSAVIVVDRSLVLTDLFVGAYASTTLADRLRLYGGIGPNLVIGYADFRDESPTETFSKTDTAVGFGGYARAGFEYRLQDRSFIGLGVRWVTNEVDFGDPIGKVDAEGWQAFLTFTQGM